MMWSADNRMKQLGFFTFQAHLKKHFLLFFGHFSLFFVPLHPISTIRVPDHLVKTGVYQITTLKPASA